MSAKRTSRSGQEEKIEELVVEGPTVNVPKSENVIEFDPGAEDAPVAEVQSVIDSSGLLHPTADLLAARDTVLAQLGGISALAASASEAAEGGEFGVENIQAVGVGIKLTAGNYTGQIAVKVFVTEKTPVSRLSPAMSVPEQVDGIITDVEEIGEISAFSYAKHYPRPVPCGVSCGHVDITAGTLGAMAVLNNNRLVFLSNNHVLANENNAHKGDHIIQPGRVDGGKDPQHLIGVLEQFTPINFPGPNTVDAAVAWTSFQLVKPSHVTYQLNPNPVSPTLLLSVIKNGRTTQATVGTITASHVNGVRVRYTSGVAIFDDQFIIQGIGGRPFSQGGDSGSVIVSAGTCQPVGLLFAGSPTHTIANPIANVCNALGIDRLVGGAD